MPAQTSSEYRKPPPCSQLDGATLKESSSSNRKRKQTQMGKMHTEEEDQAFEATAGLLVRLMATF